MQFIVLPVVVILFDDNSKECNFFRHYMLKVSNRNNRTKCKVCLKLTSKAPERPE